MTKWRLSGMSLLCIALGVAFAAPAPMPPSAAGLIGALAVAGILANAKGEHA